MLLTISMNGLADILNTPVVKFGLLFATPCGHMAAYELARQAKRSRAHTSGEQSEQLVDARV